jgi:transcriptional regulator with XRE-family HTH domain
MVIITREQSRAARALLGGLPVEAIRTKAGLGQNTIDKFENGRARMNMDSMLKLVAAYHALGIEFPDEHTVRRNPAVQEMDRAA